MTRQEANRQILRILAEEIEMQSDIRFSQLMRNIGLVSEVELCRNTAGFYPLVWVDEFYLESEELFKRICKVRKDNGQE